MVICYNSLWETDTSLKSGKLNEMLLFFVRCEGNEALSWAEQVSVRNIQSLDMKGGGMVKIGSKIL